MENHKRMSVSASFREIDYFSLREENGPGVSFNPLLMLSSRIHDLVASSKPLCSTLETLKSLPFEL